ncbi:MAG: hypothetical protein ABGY96_14340 [bacterium]
MAMVRLLLLYTSVNGKKEGLSQWWDDNGQLSSESCWRAGEAADMAYCKEQQ